MYVQLQGNSSVPSGNYTLSVQGVVPNHTVTNPTSTSTTTLRVTFPSFGATPPTQYTVYWKKVGGSGYSYVNIAPTSTYTITNLNSNQSYDVWVRYSDYSTSTGSQLYAAKQTATTIAGCGGNLASPLVTVTSGHCAQADVSWASPTAQGIPASLVPAASTYPYRLYYSYNNGTFHGFVQAISSLPVTGYHVSNLQLSTNYTFSYNFKCVGGATMTSYNTSYATCAGPARNSNEHHEYVLNGVHFVDVDADEILNAYAATLPEDDQVHEFTLVDLANNSQSNDNSNVTSGYFELTPNPTTGAVAVNYSLPASNLETAVIRIMDVQGKVVRENRLSNPAQYGTINFDLNEVEAGVYMVNIQSEGYTETKKLVVSK
jgi:hypothetical protein